MDKIASIIAERDELEPEPHDSPPLRFNPDNPAFNSRRSNLRSRKGLLPFQPKRARPYLYSDEEIRSLLRAALRMSCRYERGKLRPWVYHCLFGLLSVSGLRLGEARNLELQDADLKAAVLTIRGAKFGKTRLVPLHASTCTGLADYISRRQRHWAGRAG